MIERSLKKLGVGLLQWSIIKLFPDWYYSQTWRWGNTEAIARQQLLEKAKETTSIQLYRDLIAEAHEILLNFLNRNYSGFCLEAFISRELSVRDFKRLYMIVITLLVVRLQVSKSDKFRHEILTLFPSEVSMTEQLIQGLEIHNIDEREQALFAWNYILDIIGGDRGTANGLWKGCFVVFTENTVKRLRSRWK